MVGADFTRTCEGCEHVVAEPLTKGNLSYRCFAPGRCKGYTVGLKRFNAVCGGYINEKCVRFVLEDCLAERWRMNDTSTNKGGYLKSEGRRHVLEDILPLFPDELAEAFAPRFMSEEIDGERHEYADTLWLPSATDVFGAGEWWNEEPDSVQLEIFKRERDRVKEHIGDGTWFWWLRSPYAGSSDFFVNVGTAGTVDGSIASYSCGFAPGFDL